MKSILIIAMILFVPLLGEGQKNNKQAARKLFRQGNRLFQAENYDEASARFKEAYELKPSYKILFNIGQSEAAAKRFGSALEAFEKYLTEGGDEVRQKRQDEVRLEIRRLRELTGIIEIQGLDGMALLVDGVYRGTYPTTQRIPVSATQIHTIQGTLDDQTFTKEIRVTGGDTVSITLAPPPPSPSPDIQPHLDDIPIGFIEPEPEPDETAKRKRLLISGGTLLGVGIAAVAAGSACAGLALTKENMLESKCNGTSCSKAEQDIIDSRDRLTLISAVLWGAGGTVAAVGLALVLVSASKKDSPKVTLVPTGNSLSIAGSF